MVRSFNFNCRFSAATQSLSWTPFTMAGRWSTEQFVAELKDVQASAMAVDCLGNWVLLAGRKNLSFVDLNKPNHRIVKVARQSKWDIGCVQWNYHAYHAHRFVTACSQRLDVFDFQQASASHLCSMKAHSRTVSDVDWSPFDVNIVASCSVDTFTYFWDIRDSKKPVKSFQTVSGAYQVKWNKVTNNLFATTHDGDVRIWDPRKGNTPVQYISAHPSKIHGLDWSDRNENKFVTASQDCTMRFWDYNNPRRSEAMINSGNPVWRTRYTPFGDGVLSVVVPQLRRGENSLYLWHPGNQQTPVHTFVGHKDVVLEFQWRKPLEGVRDHQLVTWSKDQTLRIWKVDSAMQKSCGHEAEDFLDAAIDVDDISPTTSPMSPLLEFLDSPMDQEAQAIMDKGAGGGVSLNSGSGPGTGGMQPRASVGNINSSQISLVQELDSITGTIEGLRVDQANVGKRTCSLTLSKAHNYVDLDFSFPINYPNQASPTMTITQSNMDTEMQAKIQKTFSDISSVHVHQNLHCLEAGIQQILLLMDRPGPPPIGQELQSQEDRKSMLNKKYEVVKVASPTSPMCQRSAKPIYPTGSFLDSRVPFPRTSGARFCSNDRLVVFGVPAAMRKVNEDLEVTPRTLSDLVTCLQIHSMRGQSNPGFPLSMFFGSPPPPSNEGFSISSFFMEKQLKSRHRQSHSHHHHKSHGRSRDAVDSRREMERLSRRLQKVGSIKIYEISGINPVSKFLAENYRLDLSDVPATCEHNASMAMKIGRKDLVQLWKLICHMYPAKLKASISADQGPPWAYHPFGRAMVHKYLQHYGRVRDVQTLAMICCMFWDRDPPLKDTAAATTLHKSDSRVSFDYTQANVETTLASSSDSGWHVLPVMKSKRSLSWSESYDDFKIMEDRDPREREMERERILHLNNSKMLDPELKAQYEQVKKSYANMLYKWGLLNQRIQILKHTEHSGMENHGIVFPVSCFNCFEEVMGPQCPRCKYLALHCSICHVGVRGVANICLMCGHGGHASHMMDWFCRETVCPTGCGCHCLQENIMLDNNHEPTV